MIRHWTFCLLTLSTVFLTACSVGPKATNNQTAKNGFLFTNISVIPITTDTLLSQQTVWIADHKIQYIGNGKDLKVKGRPQKIDGTGQYLMPGLTDMHVHLPDEKRQRFLDLNLLAGVTHIRSMRGADDHLALRQSIANGDQQGPQILCAAPPISGRMNLDFEQLDSLIQSHQTAGYDLLKILSVKDLNTFQHILKTAQKYNIAIGGHTPRNVGIKNLLAHCKDYSIEHLGGYLTVQKNDQAVLHEMIQQTAQSNTYNCATLDWYNVWQFPLATLQQRQGLDLVPDLVEKWESKWQLYHEQTPAEKVEEDRQLTRQRMANKQIILQQLHQAGAKLLLSPDATGIYQVPGFSIVEEAKLYHEAGINNYDILKIATWQAAQYSGAIDSRGSVTVGKDADLIVLDKNPLTDITHLASVKSVLLPGRLIDCEALRKTLLTKLQ